MIYFVHEKLNVYQASLDFVEWTIPIKSRIHFSMDIKGQLERASNSIVLNLAEGNGRFSPRDRCRYFDISWDQHLNVPDAWMFYSARKR